MGSHDDFDREITNDYIHMMMFDDGTMETYAEEVNRTHLIFILIVLFLSFLLPNTWN